MAEALPREARAVIIGGGIVGCSVAYHLVKLGWQGVVLLEKKRLTCGTTWHAAGLIGQLRATANLTRLAVYTAELYGRLEAETGQATGFRQHGSLSLATSDERFEELKRGAAMARNFGLEVEVVAPRALKARHPLIESEDVVGGVWLPKDGQCDPTGVTLALAKGARQGGALLFEDCKVTGIKRRGRRVAGVVTERGEIEAEFVVNCAGLWGREVGRLAGVAVPLQACEHFYAVTEPVPGLPSGLPVVRDPDHRIYIKEDAGKILFGCFEEVAKPWGLDGIPEDFSFESLPPDLDHFAPLAEAAVKRLPLLNETGIRTWFNGPESFTPDDRYLLGEAPELDNFFLACGFNSIGIQSAGGAGKALAEWMEAGHPPFDLTDVDVRRMQPFQSNARYLAARAKEALGLLYDMHWPHRQFATARGVRHSPLHERLAAAGACFGEAAGWERPNWFAPPGVEPAYRYSWGRQNWFEEAASEHRAVREAVGLFDLSSFAKFRLEGPDAEAVLQLVSANDVAVPPGRVVYTQWLNARGGVEADLTVTRLSEEAYLVVTSAATAVRDLHWLRRHTPEGARVVITDVSAAEAVLAVMGPKARALLSELTPEDLSNASFPFSSARVLEVGMGFARAQRITYVGELGWELYVGSDFARGLFDALVEVGSAHGLRLCGFHALDSLRLEKAYRHFGHDMTDEDHVLEAGLGFAVKTEKPKSRFGPFIGRDAVLARSGRPLKRRLVQFLLEDPEPLLFGNEPVWRAGKAAGRMTSGAYGHRLGGAVGLGYLAGEQGIDGDFLAAAPLEIEVAGRHHRARASLRPFYDPQGSRTRL